MDSFPYLGSTILKDGTLDTEIFLHIQKASVGFVKLEKRVWSNRGISMKIKVDVYKTCVLSSKALTTHQRHISWLERFYQKCLWHILNIRWQSLTPNTVVLQRSVCKSIDAMIMLNQMHWNRDVVRLEDYRFPKQLFYGELMTCKHPLHKPKKRFKDCVKDNLKAMYLDLENWEERTLNRVEWRHNFHEGCNIFERERVKHAEIKRYLREGKTKSYVLIQMEVWCLRT